MRIFSYILKDYVKFVFTTIILLLFIFVLFDGIHRTGEFMQDYQPSFDLLVKYYLFQFPMLISQSLPIASLVGSVMTMVLLSRTNEITAMRAAGMGPISIGMPIICGALVFSVLAFILGDYVTPVAAKKVQHIKRVLIEKGGESSLSKGARWARDGDRLVSFKDYDPMSRVMTEVRIIKVASNFKPLESVDASLAKYRPITGEWELQGIKVTEFSPSGDVSGFKRLDSKIYNLPLEPKSLKKDFRQLSEMSRNELSERIQKGERSGSSIVSEKVEYHTKVALPFAAFVVSLIGIKFAYRSERSVETVKSVLFAMMIGMSYWLFLSAGKAISKQGSFFPPILGAWLANIVIFSYGVFDIYMISRRK